MAKHYEGALTLADLMAMTVSRAPVTGLLWWIDQAVQRQALRREERETRDGGHHW